MAVGFILGGAISKVVASLVNDIINPMLGIALGATDNLSKLYFKVGKIKIMWGSFINTPVHFIIIASVVYFGVKLLRLDKLDRKKDK